MKSVEVVKTARGWHVTRRYCGRTMATAFFPFDPKKKKQTKADGDKDKYVKEWMGE